MGAPSTAEMCVTKSGPSTLAPLFRQAEDIGQLKKALHASRMQTLQSEATQLRSSLAAGKACERELSRQLLSIQQAASQAEALHAEQV